ncbi:amidohydrolase [Streptomyces sp. NPDC015130]|uniref:amidohydrolase n=1 Tax=Streptomyces sp. NPDC015130 TaxID=3364940 RepID=UPI0036FAC7BF
MSELEEAQWRHRRDLLPEGDPLLLALEELAARPRTHTLREVRLIDPLTGDPGPVEDLEVTDGAYVTRPSPRRGSGPWRPERERPCAWYAVSGFVDAHAHVSSLADLVGLLVHGVTACRQLWGEPAHLMAVGARRARHVVLPRLWVTAGVIDGPCTRLPKAVTVVDDERAVRRVIEETAAFGFDGVKVYDDMETDVFDRLLDAADEAGVPVVGHAPERVGFATAARRMRTSEHLYGAVPNVFRLPADRRWPALADALAGPGVAERAAALSTALAESGRRRHLICPTLVCWRARSGERRHTRPSRAALAAATPSRRRAWQHAAREALGLAPEEARRRGGTVDRLGELVARTDNIAGRLLVGTDCGNPFVLAGPSFHKELAELERAGLDFPALLRAATVNAYRATAPLPPPSAPAAGAAPPSSPDLVLYRRPPGGRAAGLARPDAVLIDGVLLDGADLDRLWALRLAGSGLDASVWPRGELDPPVSGDRPTKEGVALAGRRIS